jgi:hypothetical protein
MGKVRLIQRVVSNWKPDNDKGRRIASTLIDTIETNTGGLSKHPHPKYAIGVRLNAGTPAPCGATRTVGV